MQKYCELAHYANTGSHYPQSSPFTSGKGRRESQKAIMVNISAVNNQTLNSSELHSVLGEGGHVALNTISLIVLSLPMVLSNGFLIIVLLMDRTTASALRITLINTLAAAMTTGLGFMVWHLTHIVRRARLIDDQSLVLATRTAAGFFVGSFLLRSIALCILSVVVFSVIKKGPPKKKAMWCLSAVVGGELVFIVIFGSLQASDMATTSTVFLDGYHVYLVSSNFGRYMIVSVGLIVEISSKTITFTFAALAFRLVKRNVSIAIETGIRKAMLKFLISTMVLNAIIIFINVLLTASLFRDSLESVQQNSRGSLALTYVGQIVIALSTILVPILLTVQFRSVSTTMKEKFGCGKVTPTIHPSLS